LLLLDLFIFYGVLCILKTFPVGILSN